MFSLPSLPAWEAIHPVLVHLPIGVLIFAPVLLVIALLDARRRRTWAAAGLVAMIFGTAFAWIAVLSGEAAAEIVPETARIEATLELHEEYAETARTIFVVLTLLLAGVLALSLTKAKWARPAVVVGSVLLAGGYGAGLLVLANTGHQGGRLVHELGVRAPLTAAPGTAPADLEREHGHEDDDDDD